MARPRDRLLVQLATAAIVMASGGCGEKAAPQAGPQALRTAPYQGPMSVRGLHCWVPPRDQVAECERFIRDVLPKEGVNLLILQFHYYYQFQRHPEIGGGGACGAPEVQRLVKACRESGIRLIPQVNCLGHQDMPYAPGAKTLLDAYPAFNEAPHIPAGTRGQKGVRCYCPRHPDLHRVMFDLIDELAEATEANAFHVGMDEVFNIADANCPRCRGADPADVFAEEVNRLHDHLAARGLTMWMWGDRLIDANAAGTNTWEGSANGTWRAIERIPKDIVICDWHYKKAPDTPRYFANKGFRVVACPWQDANVGLGYVDLMRRLAADADPQRAGRALGMVQTTWTFLHKFAAAYGQPAAGPGTQQAACFKAVMSRLREETPASRMGE